MPTIKKGIICEDENLQNKIYPYTQMDCVYDSEGNRLDNVLNELDSEIETSLNYKRLLNSTDNIDDIKTTGIYYIGSDVPQGVQST